MRRTGGLCLQSVQARILFCTGRVTQQMQCSGLWQQQQTRPRRMERTLFLKPFCHHSQENSERPGHACSRREPFFQLLDQIPSSARSCARLNQCWRWRSRWIYKMGSGMQNTQIRHCQVLCCLQHAGAWDLCEKVCLKLGFSCGCKQQTCLKPKQSALYSFLVTAFAGATNCHRRGNL